MTCPHCGSIGIFCTSHGELCLSCRTVLRDGKVFKSLTPQRVINPGGLMASAAMKAREHEVAPAVGRLVCSSCSSAALFRSAAGTKCLSCGEKVQSPARRGLNELPTKADSRGPHRVMASRLG